MPSKHSGRAFATDNFVVPSSVGSIPSVLSFADFCCPQGKLIVELDGGQHAARVAADQKRSRFLEEQGYRVLRFWNHDVLKDTVAVLERIAGAKSPSPLPAPWKGEGEEENTVKPIDENS